MKIIELSQADALYYCTRDEDHYFDRKAFGIKGAKIQKIAVAFANADGGEFVIGVEDSSVSDTPIKRWNGQESTEHYNGAIQALSELSPSVDFRFDFIRIAGVLKSYVLRVKINKGLQVHKTSSDDVYIRNGAQSLPLKGHIKILELSHAKGITSEEDSLVPSASINDLESSRHLAEFLGQLPISEPEPLNFLLQENLVDPATWVPRVAAVLMFFDNPCAILPKQCGLRVVRYDSSKEDIDRDALTEDNFLVEGPLHGQINQAYKIIQKVLSNITTWTLDGVQPPEYPKEAIWEVLVNTAIHRDYSISDNVLVSIFRNRIEFKSPGRLPGFVTTDNILDNRFSRNSKLVRLLSKYSGSPNKDLGEGMNTAFQKMKDAGLRAPEVIEDGNFVKVVLKHVPIEDAENLVIHFLKKHHTINNRQALDLLGLDTPEKVTAIFSRMREKGSIRRVDATSGAKSQWELCHTKS